MKKSTLFVRTSLFFAAVSVCGVLPAKTPEIRFTSAAPFDAKGGRVESVWKGADTLTRFLEIVKNNVALDQSEAQFLFDGENLYASLKGWHDAQYDFGRIEKTIGHVDSFELRVKPAAEDLQVMVDEFGRLEIYRNKNKLEGHAIRAVVSKTVEKTGLKRALQTYNLTIPLKAIGIAAPTDDLKLKLGIFRHNFNVHERMKLYANRCECSSYTPLPMYNFGVSDQWADAVMTRRAGEAAKCEAPANGARVNLVPNAEFDVPGRGFGAFGRTEYRETMAMSGEWTYRGWGKDYQILSFKPWGLKPSTRYTMVVKCRSFGAGSGLRAIELVRNKAGKVQEGACITMLTPVGPEMHEYYLPFTTSPDEPWTIVLYKVDSKADDTGIDFGAVKCFEGELSSFEIRKITRPGRMAVVPGTEIPEKPCGVGRFAKPVKALMFFKSKYDHRTVRELFAGTGMDVDYVMLDRAKNSDVYSTYGDPAAITRNLKEGKYALYVVPGAKRDLERLGKEMKGYLETNVKKGAKRFDYADYRRPLTLAEIRGSKFVPFEDWAKCETAIAAYRAAVGTPADAAKTERREYAYMGQVYAEIRSLDAQGRTVDWRLEKTPVAGAKFAGLENSGADFTASVEGDTAGAKLVWEFADFSGRVLAKGEAAAAAKVAFTVPEAKLYTNFGALRVQLVREGKVLDQQGFHHFVKENDRRRLMDDFTGSCWPGSGGAAEIEQLFNIGITASVIPPSGNMSPEVIESYYSKGMAAGGSWIGEGSTFCGWPQKTNVRAQNFNTKKWRAEKPVQLRKQVAGWAKYGLLDNALCDEPNLSRPGSADELDAHPENLEEYRLRMERKYGTIAEYNRRHETAYKAFAELGQALQADARKSGKFAEFIEWRNFNVDRWCEAIRIVSDGAKAVDPAPFTMCNSFGQSALSGNDYYKLMTRAGLGFSTEYTAMVYFGRNAIYNFDEFIRSFRPDMRCWGWTGYFYSRERARFMPWWFACHRYGGFSWYAATAPGYNVVDDATAAQTVDGRDLMESMRDNRLFDGLGKVFTVWEWAKRDVAIYYSHDSMLLSTILGPETKNGEIAAKSPLHDHMYSRQNAQYVIEDLLYQHDFVAPEQIVKNGRLAGCRALFMPRVIAMSDAEVAAVKAFLAKGGRILCDGLPGDYDELGVKRAANPFGGVGGITVFGRNFDDRDGNCRKTVAAFLEGAGATKALASDRAVELYGREAMHYVSGDADVYPVIRMGGRSDDVEPQEFVFAKQGHVYDVVNRKYLGFTDRVTAAVPLHEASVFAVLPAKIGTIAINSPTGVAPGADLAATLRIEQSEQSINRTIPAYVLHVELVPPSGRVRFHFKRNLETKNGAAKLDFPIAHNDEKGVWKLVVTEPLTGVSAERAFRVE